MNSFVGDEQAAVLEPTGDPEDADAPDEGPRQDPPQRHEYDPTLRAHALQGRPRGRPARAVTRQPSRNPVMAQKSTNDPTATPTGTNRPVIPAQRYVATVTASATATASIKRAR